MTTPHSTLAISRGVGMVVLTWTNGTPPFQLQRTPELSPTTWTNVGNPTLGTTRTVPSNQPHEYFRLEEGISLLDAELTETNTHLKWSAPDLASMADYIENFTLERSPDNSNWSPLATLAPSVTSYNDATAPNPNLYYRLTGHTHDGVTFQYNVVQVHLSSQVPGQFKWFAQGGGAVGGDEATVTCVAVDPVDHTVVVGGKFKGQANFGDGVIRGTPSGNTYDMFLLKYAANGTLLKVMTKAGNGNDMINGVCIDVSQNITFTGQMGSSLDFGLGPLPWSSASDIVIVSFDANFNVRWNKSFGGLDTDSGIGVDCDTSGNVYLTAFCAQPAINFGGGSLSGNGGNNACVAKFNVNGSHIWSRRFACSTINDGNNPHAISVDNLGNVIICGHFYLSMIIDGETWTAPAGFDSFIIKLNSSNGATAWKKRLGVTGANYAYGASASKVNGEVVVSGGYSGTFGGHVVPSNGLGIYMVKYLADGTVVWSKGFGGGPALQDVGNSVAISPVSGNVLMVGEVASACDFGGGYTFGNSAANFFVAEYDSAGSFIFVRRVIPARGFAAAYDPANQQCLAGGYFGGTTGDFGGGPVNGNGAGKAGMVVAYQP